MVSVVFEFFSFSCVAALSHTYIEFIQTDFTTHTHPTHIHIVRCNCDLVSLFRVVCVWFVYLCWLSLTYFCNRLNAKKAEKRESIGRMLTLTPCSDTENEYRHWVCAQYNALISSNKIHFVSFLMWCHSTFCGSGHNGQCKNHFQQCFANALVFVIVLFFPYSRINPLSFSIYSPLFSFLLPKRWWTCRSTVSWTVYVYAYMSPEHIQTRRIQYTFRKIIGLMEMNRTPMKQGIIT